MLIVNKTPNWREKFKNSELTSEYMELKTFISDTNKTAFHFEGNFLTLHEEFSEVIPTAYYYEIKSPHLFNEYPDNKTLYCSFEDKEYKFIYRRKKGRSYIFPNGQDSTEFLKSKMAYKLYKQFDNTFEIREI